MVFDLDSFIALLLIRVKSFRESSSLTRALAWKFGIITVVKVTRSLEFEGLIGKVTDHGINNYYLTNKGIEFLEQHLDEGKLLLLEVYPEQYSFIVSLFNEDPPRG